MHIKRKALGKKFWVPVILIGIVIFVTASAYLSGTCKRQAESNLLKTAEYMKVQCSTYTHYNNGSETQALLRAVESNRLIRDKINQADENDVELSEELLKEYTEKLWLHGVIILDGDGNKIYGYAQNEQTEKQLLENFSKETVLVGDGHKERNYTQRIYLTDGSYINMSAAARGDAPGVIITYYYISAECAKSYSLTLQSLMDGYQIATDGTIMVVDEGRVIACNDEKLIGQNTADNVIVQTLKENADSKHIVHIIKNKSYGVMLKQRDYYIYAYVADNVVFSTLFQNIFFIMILYMCAIITLWLILKSSERQHQKLEMEKEVKYKAMLLESAKRADAANIAKTEFLQRMSHDIRTPINGICGMLEVAEHYAGDLDKQTECRSKIREASHLLLEWINEVLDMGKLESGEIVLENQPFNLHEVLDEVITVIEKLSSEQGIQLIHEDFLVEHWKLTGSTRHVKRLLMNIMSNAVKYNKKNGMIKIKCCELPSQNDGEALIEFTCEDTGIGMSEEYQKRIFEPFTQESTSVRTNYGGTGLGMSIAKGLTDKMNGTLTFESYEGVGTTFVVTIPFRIDENETVENADESSEHELSIKENHILLVEDNELNMEISEFVLETEGAVITKAWNGSEAVEIFESSKPGEFDAILMDVMMPVMDGCQAAEKIRAMTREDAKTIPIIAMTANAFTEDRIKTRNAGMNAHISKPLDPKLVIETLDKLVRAGGGRLGRLIDKSVKSARK